MSAARECTATEPPAVYSQMFPHYSTRQTWTSLKFIAGALDFGQSHSYMPVQLLHACISGLNALTVGEQCTLRLTG